MDYEQVIIGFDAREMWFEFNATWSLKRREGFLLRDDIKKPLSTDTIVWLSLFRSHRKIINGEKITTGSVIDLELPLQQRSMDNLWKDLSAMQLALSNATELAGKHYWIIAIAELMSREDKERLESTYPFKPKLIDPNWKLLGFDVSQDNLTSSLTNARYESDEFEVLKARWISHLNQFHLFTDDKEADKFADWADERDHGHAPHQVYGLYLVDQH